MRIHTFQHVPFEWVGQIERWAQERGHGIGATRFFEPFTFPDANAVDLLLVMGGPMGVHDEAEYPWLHEEKKFLYNYVHSGKKVLGICLGAQLLADVMGARVYKNPTREIGWFEVALTPEGIQSGFFSSGQKRLVTFHWHGDTFDLPRGAVQLARSEACHNQAFRRGRNVLGLQFHIEMSGAEVKEISTNCAHELSTPEQFVQDAATMARLSDRFAETARRELEHILDSFTAS